MSEKMFEDNGKDYARVRFVCVGCNHLRDKIVTHKRGTKAPQPKYCDDCKIAVSRKTSRRYSRKVKKTLLTRLAFGSLTILFLFCAGCVERFSEVRGSVWCNRMPAKGVTVKLEELSYYRSYVTKTDGDGEFCLARIIAGNLRRGVLTVSDGDKMLHREYVNLPSIKLIEVE